MELRALESKKIKLIDINGEEFIGTVGDYIYPEDNGGQEAIIIDCKRLAIQFNAEEISSAEILNHSNN